MSSNTSILKTSTNCQIQSEALIIIDGNENQFSCEINNHLVNGKALPHQYNISLNDPDLFNFGENGKRIYLQESISYQNRLFERFKSNPSLLDELLEQGMDPNIKDEEGKSLIIECIEALTTIFSIYVNGKLIKNGGLSNEIRNNVLTIFTKLIDADAALDDIPTGPVLSSQNNILDYLLMRVEEDNINCDAIEAVRILIDKGLKANGYKFREYFIHTSDFLIYNAQFELLEILLTTSSIERQSNTTKLEMDFSNYKDAFLAVMSKKEDIIITINNLPDSQLAPETADSCWLYAVMYKDKEAINKLLAANVPYHNINNEISIEKILLSGFNPEFIASLFNSFPKIAHETTFNGESFMHKIAEEKNIELYLEFLAKGFSPDILNEDNLTSLDVMLDHIKCLAEYDEILSKILEYSNDPFYKDKKFDFSSKKIYIGVPVVEGVWDSQHVATIRAMGKKNPSIIGKTFTKNEVNPEYILNFNALIIPGGVDSYPKGKNESFSLIDFIPKEGIENLYLSVFHLAYSNSIPLVGICLGNQYHALTNGERLVEVQDHNGKPHLGNVQPGTMSYFMMLNSAEQYKYIHDAEFNPDIGIVISTHHNYAIADSVDPYKVGVYSEEGIVQSYYNGNHVTFQFHPEVHAATSEERNFNDYTSWYRQVQVFENLGKMGQHHRQATLKAKYLHDQKTYEPFQPHNSIEFSNIMKDFEKYYLDLQDKLAQKGNRQCFSDEELDKTYFDLEEDICGAQDILLIGQEFNFGDKI